MRSASSLPSGTPICEWDKMPSDCSPFNPYLEDIIPVKIAGVTVLATHDLVGHHWTTSSLCHFVDRVFLSDLPIGRDMLSSLLAPDPPCKRVLCTKDGTGLIVLGMLGDALPISLNTGGIQSKGRKLDISAGNVLVVDSLPVPLHLSMKSLLKAANPQDGKRLQRALRKTQQLIDGQPGALAQYFPQRFLEHLYWKENPRKAEKLIPSFWDEEKDGWMARGMHVMTLSDIGRYHTAVQDHCSADIVEIRSCACCGVFSAKLFKCGSCSTTHYCGKACQKADWKRHKQVCANEQKAAVLQSRRK